MRSRERLIEVLKTVNAKGLPGELAHAVLVGFLAKDPWYRESALKIARMARDGRWTMSEHMRSLFVDAAHHLEQEA